jgi:malate dehydrogenase
MARPKVGIVGAGQVGATLAMRLAESGACDVALLDVVKGMPQGKALDMAEALPVAGRDAAVAGGNGYGILRGSRVVVITAGIPRKPGMDRADLLKTNARIMRDAARNAARVAPKCVLVVVSNPLDALTYLAWKTSRFPRRRVVGMAGVLDSARFAAFLAEALDVSVADVRAMVLGGHGDSMVPLPRYTTVSGIPVTDLLDARTLRRLVDRTRKGGAEIVSYLKTGSAYYAPSAAVAAMVESILLDRKRILPACAVLDGEYGVRDCAAGVPAKIGARGVEAVVRLPLKAGELKALRASVRAVKKVIRDMRRMA